LKARAESAGAGVDGGIGAEHHVADAAVDLGGDVVENRGDPTRCPFECEFAERGWPCWRTRVLRRGPDVDVGAAAGELPALCAIRIDSSRSGSRSPSVNEAGGSPTRSFSIGETCGERRCSRL
jgi:hypothetical protein